MQTAKGDQGRLQIHLQELSAETENQKEKIAKLEKELKNRVDEVAGFNQTINEKNEIIGKPNEESRDSKALFALQISNKNQEIQRISD